jgi:hypothetical protein
MFSHKKMRFLIEEMPANVNKNFLAIITFTMLLFCPFARAGSIDMPIGHNGRVVYGKGGHTDIWGSGIIFTGLTDGHQALGMSWARLFFSTGQGEGWKGNTLTFAPGGEFSVRGCIGCGHKGDILGVLMSGTFLNAELVKEGNKTIFIAKFLEHLNPALAALLKIPDQSEGELELLLGPGGTTRSCIVDNVTGGSLNLFSLSEPSSLLILATSLVGLFLILRIGGSTRQNTPLPSTSSNRAIAL